MFPISNGMISIIIPTFKEERVIGKTLKKLSEGLSGVPHEIIVADDGSTDRTVLIAKQYADRVVTRKPDEVQSIAAGRNRGAGVARGNYLVFMDADVEILHPREFFTQALATFAKYPRLVGLTANIRVFPEVATWGDRIVFGTLNLFHRLVNNVMYIGRAAGEFQMVRRNAFTQLGGYQEHIIASEDYEFFGRLGRIGETRLDPALVVFHSGRRAHTIGWPRLLMEWAGNAIAVMFTKRAISKKWKIIR